MLTQICCHMAPLGHNEFNQFNFLISFLINAISLFKTGPIQGSISSALLILMAWCSCTRASVATVLSTHPWVSSCLWDNRHQVGTPGCHASSRWELQYRNDIQIWDVNKQYLTSPWWHVVGIVAIKSYHVVLPFGTLLFFLCFFLNAGYRL